MWGASTCDFLTSSQYTKIKIKQLKDLLVAHVKGAPRIPYDWEKCSPGSAERQRESGEGIPAPSMQYTPLNRLSGLPTPKSSYLGKCRIFDDLPCYSSGGGTLSSGHLRQSAQRATQTQHFDVCMFLLP